MLLIGLREIRGWAGSPLDAPDARTKGQKRAQKHSPTLEFFSKVFLQGCGGGSGPGPPGSSDWGFRRTQGAPGVPIPAGDRLRGQGS
jgi:hypothetical protein